MCAALPTNHFAALTETMCGLIARHGLARRLAAPLIVLIWGRVRGIGAQAEALLARVRAGQLRRYPARTPPRPSATKRRPNTPRALPHRRAWLVVLIPQTAASAAHLQTLLTHPDTPALLAAAPQLRRTLRPLCHMLGVDLPKTPPPAPPPHTGGEAHPPPSPATPRPPAPQTPPATAPIVFTRPAFHRRRQCRSRDAPALAHRISRYPMPICALPHRGGACFAGAAGTGMLP